MVKHPDEPRLELLQGTLDMLVLRTLQWGAQHGHGIGQAIRAQSDELLRVETGSLYPALHRLEKRGWLKSEWGISEANQRAAIAEERAGIRFELTQRQRQLMSLVAMGMSNKEIAANLNLSEFTVKNHIYRVMKQVDAQNRHEACHLIRVGGLNEEALPLR